MAEGWNGMSLNPNCRMFMQNAHNYVSIAPPTSSPYSLIITRRGVISLRDAMTPAEILLSQPSSMNPVFRKFAEGVSFRHFVCVGA